MLQGNWWKCLCLAGLLGVWMLSAAVSSESGSQPAATLADDDHEGDSEDHGELLADEESPPEDPEIPNDEDFEGETEGPGDELIADDDEGDDHEEGELLADDDHEGEDEGESHSLFVDHDEDGDHEDEGEGHFFLADHDDDGDHEDGDADHLLT